MAETTDEVVETTDEDYQQEGETIAGSNTEDDVGSMASDEMTGLDEENIVCGDMKLSTMALAYEAQSEVRYLSISKPGFKMMGD